MFASLFILLVLHFTDLSRIRGNEFKPFSRFNFWVLVGVFIVLFQIGARHADSPYIVIGQVATGLYFSYFLILVPIISSLENSLVDLNNIKLSPALQLWQGKGQNFFAITITSLKNNLNLINYISHQKIMLTISNYSNPSLYAGVRFQKSTAYSETADTKVLVLWGTEGYVYH